MGVFRVLGTGADNSARLYSLQPREFREIIQNEFLGDSHMNLAQIMLAKKFDLSIGGLESSLLYTSRRCLSLADRSKATVQIINTGHDHWVTVVILPGKDPLAYVYDCSPSQSALRASDVEVQIAMMLKTSKTHITSVYVQCQVDTSGKDCGLYAIATATEYCFTKSLAYITLDKNQLRKHWAQCIVSGELVPFPKAKLVGRKEGKHTVESFPVECTCRLPSHIDSGESVQCDKCDVFFHFSCVGLKVAPPGDEQWFCSSCC